MDKKNILFVIHSLDAGGAEKSLVSLLSSISQEHFNIDLMAVNPYGIFKNQIPRDINIIETPKNLICECSKINKKRFWENATLKIILIKLWCIISNHLRGNKSKKKMCHSQYYNMIWKKFIPNNPKMYDVAISYIDGMNYYVIDHINAKKKILWCHNDYNKLDYIPEYDLPYYSKADYICTISEICKKSLIENFPNLSNKIHVVENIISEKIINAEANKLDEIQHAGDGFINDNRYKLVSIGRLSKQKGFDFAVEVAKSLKEKDIKFCWYILGEGELRAQLEEMAVHNNVSDVLKFIGVRSNPYPYIKKADLYIMPSRYEGKSIALEEAKILCKPIVVTNYPSVKDAIEDGKNGLIVNINSQAITDGIIKLFYNKDLCDRFVNNLQNEDYSNEKQVITQFIDLLK